MTQHLPTLSALPFFNADLETKPRKSCSQRREEKFKDTIVKPAAEVTPEVHLEFQIPTMPTNTIQMQQNNPTWSNI